MFVGRGLKFLGRLLRMVSDRRKLKALADIRSLDGIATHK
jgi:hypothetical protein